MISSVRTGLEAQNKTTLVSQAVSFFLHSLLALIIWLGLMLLGYAAHPVNISQSLILLASFTVPLIAGFVAARLHSSEMATLVWMLGVIWFLIACILVMDLPTGPNQCFHCDAAEKMMRTFFSLPRPSGLMDNDGPFIGSWPAAALFGYSIGAKLGFRRPK